MTEVYDLFYPSPPSLEEMALMSAALDLWRQDVDTYRFTDTMENFDMQRNASVHSLRSKLPSTIFDRIKKYTKKFGQSIQQWLDDHYQVIFDFDYHCLARVAHYIDAFVYDFDGNIHYCNTARRLMASDRLNDVEKFRIAATYCFEEEIFDLWPSVSSCLKLRDFDYYKCPQLYYWLCHLNNQLYTIPAPDTGSVFIRDLLRARGNSRRLTAVEYFWNRSERRDRRRCVRAKFYEAHYLLFRYMIKNLTTSEYDRLLVDMYWPNCSYLSLILNGPARHMYERTMTSDSDMIALMKEVLLRSRFENTDVSDKAAGLCVEWASFSDHVKQTVIEDVIIPFMVHIPCRYWFGKRGLCRLLLTVLADASEKDRLKIWNSRSAQIMLVLPSSQQREYFSLFFHDDDKMNNQFKMDDYVYFDCIKAARYEILNEFLRYIHPNESDLRNARAKILNHLLITCRNSLFDSWFTMSFKNAKLFKQFIDDAYDDANDAMTFKRNFLSLFDTSFLVNAVKRNRNDNFIHIMKYVQYLAPSKQFKTDMKQRCIVPAVRNLLTASHLLNMKCNEWEIFMNWCFNHVQSEIESFKTTISVDRIVTVMIRQVMFSEKKYVDDEYEYEFLSDEEKTQPPNFYQPRLISFLKWYFATPENYNQFKEKYCHDDVFKMLTEGWSY